MQYSKRSASKSIVARVVPVTVVEILVKAPKNIVNSRAGIEIVSWRAFDQASKAAKDRKKVAGYFWLLEGVRARKLNLTFKMI